ncbi:MAG: ribF [Chloroflexi bacterium]|jgi:riboflavin kinase/FMN adenylyltransferase|nr:ribF [Chloroflexota bacterium]
MQHISSLDEIQLKDSWLTIGSFDGVHLGHQAIIQKLTEGAHAQGVPAVVLTFHPHPAVVLGKRQNDSYLTTPQERAALLGELGVDVIITQPFNPEIAAMSALDFISWAHDRLGFSQLCVGHDFALGRGRQGNVEFLGQLGRQFSYSMNIAEPVTFKGQVVSSSQIRSALIEGDMTRARVLLGRPFHLSGEVIHGDSRGRTIGIPTANLALPLDRMVPKTGVYACLASVDGTRWAAVTNVGIRPTFENQPATPQVEAHLLDFSQDLYSKQLELEFIDRLRDEQRFPNIPALVEQIQRDIIRGRERLSIFSSTSE